ncbi:biotin-dependent carboxyltransferase family protein [Cryptosporangium phraense]|uniref:Biotin-dependent carboxyltransferase family protein n=1 Tax=Cryptosporangium phraense TaxID=2593070 RepID=A0A545AUF5_9ACTN|nr:biotin-dependent carboxyltransferase family protein [Cryptosporangium phraense]TQS44964.1 biotin-dependent carboxyltransferase family protein [Cryptosporangium phraense]
MLTIRSAGPLTTVQDRGRPGWAHLGVPRSGAADRPALDRANALVGNAPSAAALEVTLGGLVAVFDTDAVVAVTGARCPLSIDAVPARHATAVGVPAGAVLRLNTARGGVRAYLAVAGGIAADPVLGSRSTDTLSILGPPRVQDGDRLPLGTDVFRAPATGGSAELDLDGVLAGARARAVVEPAIPAEPVLRVHPGPRESWFSPAALDALYTAPWIVTPESDRVGARLDGPALARAIEGELPSEGMVAGALQVPPSGPVLFLADHPVTGGYPVIGVVNPDDLPLAAQSAPGTTLRLRRADVAEPSGPFIRE